jgi:hypothetical protein
MRRARPITEIVADTKCGDGNLLDFCYYNVIAVSEANHAKLPKESV